MGGCGVGRLSEYVRKALWGAIGLYLIIGVRRHEARVFLSAHSLEIGRQVALHRPALALTARNANRGEVGSHKQGMERHDHLGSLGAVGQP